MVKLGIMNVERDFYVYKTKPKRDLRAVFGAKYD